MKSNGFDSREALHEALCARIVDALQAGIAARGHAVIAVSGGSTPKPLFERLASADLPWEKVTVTLVDERWVDPTSPDSNENLVRSTLLRDKASSAAFVGLKSGDATAIEGVDACESRLAALPRPFDVVILGMGGDGHTASFFPHAEALPEVLGGTRLCGAVTPLNAPYERMTLTLPVLLEARVLILHIEGAEKERVLREALRGDDVAQMPVRSVLHQEQTPLELYFTQE